MASDDVLLQWTGAGGLRAVAYEDVPGSNRGLIELRALSGAEARMRDLAEELRLELRAVSALETEAPAGEGLEERDRRRLLVVVGDAAAPSGIDAEVAAWLRDAEASEDEGVRIMPVLKEGTNPTTALPGELRPYNVGWWRHDVRELSQAILAASGVASEDYRLFISYRRVDCLDLAEQLYLEMTRRRFAVFLDRFTIPPGLDFQDRLGTELEDKSMVALLESKDILGSDWVAHEIAFAKNRKLGLLALHLPDGATAPNVDESDRRRLKDADLIPAVGEGGPRLTDDALQRVAGEIERAHNLALFRRRESMRQNFRTAILRKIGVEPKLLADGVMQVAYNARLYHFWLTPRPPELNDYHCTVHRGLPFPEPHKEASRTVVGPSLNMRATTRGHLQWVGSLCDAEQYDESQLEGLAELLAQGGL